VSERGNYVFAPPKSLEDVLGYDKVLSRMCIIHIGKSLAYPGVKDDLLRMLPGSPAEQEASFYKVQGDIKKKLARLNTFTGERLSPQQLSLRAQNLEKIMEKGYSRVGRPPVSLAKVKVVPPIMVPVLPQPGPLPLQAFPLMPDVRDWVEEVLLRVPRLVEAALPVDLPMDLPMVFPQMVFPAAPTKPDNTRST